MGEMERGKGKRVCIHSMTASDKKNKTNDKPVPYHKICRLFITLLSKGSLLPGLRNHVATFLRLRLWLCQLRADYLGCALLQLSRHFLPAPQDSLLPASLFISLGTSLLAPQTHHLLTLCAYIKFIYLLIYLPRTNSVRYWPSTWMDYDNKYTKHCEQLCEWIVL